MDGGITPQSLGLTVGSWLGYVGIGAGKISSLSRKRGCGVRWGKLNPRKYRQSFDF